MKYFTVYRNNQYINTVEAESAEKAIELTQEEYSHDNFGSAGALTERDVSRENEYLKAEFTAVEGSDDDEEKSISADEVINRIAETLREADGKWIEKIANQVLTEEVKYTEDSMFKIKP